MKTANINPTSTQRMTISMPGYLYEQLQKYLEPGKRSSFVVEALEKEILELRQNLRKYKIEKKDPIDELFEIAKVTPKMSHEEIMKAIHKGRLKMDKKGKLYREGF